MSWPVWHVPFPWLLTSLFLALSQIYDTGSPSFQWIASHPHLQHPTFGHLCSPASYPQPEPTTMTNTSPGRLWPRIHSSYGNFLLMYLPLAACSRMTIIYDSSTCSPWITRRWPQLVNSGQVLVNGGTWVVFEETVLVSQKIFFTNARWTYQCLVHSTAA